VAAALTRALGKPARYMTISADKAREAMLAGGLPEAAVDLVSALRAYEREGHNTIVTSTVADLLGRPPRTYVEVAQTAVVRPAQQGELPDPHTK
jgi:NAD(P)H dehydrogenase (quinone)